MKTTNHLYILQPYTGRNSRFICPSCGKANQFSRYIDAGSGEILANDVGRCNRVDKCGYHFTPKQYFNNNSISHPDLQVGELPPVTLSKVERKAEVPSYIDPQVFNSTLTNHQNNNLVKYLQTLFNEEQLQCLIDLYNIGTSSRWGGGTTIFWQMDASSRLRTGKLIKYDPKTGKRMKLTNWVHAVLKLEEYNLKQCLFGEHLLSQFPNKTVGIVESEKTAIIASVFLPDLIWLATGGAENLTKEKAKPIRGRNVILFPDASKDGRIYQKWMEKAKQFGFECSDYMERHATDEQKAQGVDIADFLENEKKPTRVPKIEPVLQTQAIEHNGTTQQIPYSTPSPVALIDSKIKNPPKFEGKQLLIKNRKFTSASRKNIELVGIRDYGYCNDWKTHKQFNGYCPACLLNCQHTIRINGKLQKKEYTQLEILLMQPA